MKPVNEASSCTFTATFYGTDGGLFTPSTARWRLTDVASGKVLQDWLSLTVTESSVDIIISAALNAILNNRNTYEERALAIQAEPGLTGQFTEEVRFRVKNLKAFK